jgi:hypothetical protein
MHKSAMKCNKTLGKWCKNKHGASKIIDTFETYQPAIFEQKAGQKSGLKKIGNHLPDRLKPAYRPAKADQTGYFSAP